MLLSFDFSNLLIRHASNPYNNAVDEQERDISGVVGALRQINRICQQVQPSHLLIARDDSRSNLLRSSESKAYKADRPKSDGNIGFQFQLAWSVLEVLGMPETMVSGYEADDVLASASERYPGSVMIVTGDKDLLALCSERVVVRLLRPGQVLDCRAAECLDLVGVAPELVTDYKALAGDRSDGIPGVPSIGHKRAVALLQAYGSLEKILATPLPLPDFPAAVSKALAEHRQLAEQSYRLAQMERGLNDFVIPEYRPTAAGDQLDQALRGLGVKALASAKFSDIAI